jgi:hypothetical protein
MRYGDYLGHYLFGSFGLGVVTFVLSLTIVFAAVYCLYSLIQKKD